MSKKIFVSFDYENDKHYKHLLEAWHNNRQFDFTFRDMSSSEINSSDIGRVKAALTNKINQATHTLVLVGRYANSQHSDHNLIGYKNWINFEIAKSKENNNKLIAVQLDSNVALPNELINERVSWARNFTEANIISAIEAA